MTAVRDGRYKFIAAPRRELYDTEADPGELHDLVGVEPARGRRAGARPRRHEREARGGRDAADSRGRLNPRSKNGCGRSATWRQTVSRATLADRPRGDPKDKIGLYNLLKRAAQDSVAGQLDAGIAKVREVLAADPEVIEAYTMLGNMNVKAHRLPDAIAAYQKALAIDPEHEGAAWSLALAYQEAGKLDEARAGFERVRQLNPRDARPLYQLADLSVRRGDFAEAAETLEKGLTLARRSIGVSREARRGAARTEAA